MIGRSVFVLSVLVFVAVPASAQSAWGPRNRISFSVGAQLDTELLSQSFSFDEYVEPAAVTARGPRKAPVAFDGGVATNIYGPIGAGLAVTYVNNRGNAEVRADLPHPFYFEQLREVSGTVSVQHTELVTHLNVVYLVTSSVMEFSLSAGPSIFKVEQDLVVDVDYEETYPFDAATFSRAVTERAQHTKVGYHIAADAVWKAARYFGLGGSVRFSRARVAYATVDGLDVTEMDVGGVQVAGGIRLMY